MTLALPGTHHDITAPSVSAHHRRLGTAAALFSVTGWLTWLTWRFETISIHVVPVAAVMLESLGVVAGVVFSVVLMRPAAGRQTLDHSSDRAAAFPAAITAHLWPAVAGASAPRTCQLAARMLRLEGLRRVALVAITSASLLLGVSPMPLPSPAAAAGLAIGLIGTSFAHVLLSGRVIAIGDRTRWSFAAQGEMLATSSTADVTRRRWTASVAAAVVLSLAIALRGISDRWTHGLEPMATQPRAVALLLGLALTLGGLYTLATTDPPDSGETDAIARRHDERTARQPALACVVLVGVIGLVAGLLTGGVDTADDDPARIEQVSQREPRVGADE
jgi:hypothetical protein